MLDLDGTTIPNKMDGMPSYKVTSAIEKANKKLKVIIVTARPYKWAVHIVKHLKLKTPYVVDNGAQIIDPSDNLPIWEKPINKEDIDQVIKIARKYKCILTYSDGDSVLYNPQIKLPPKIYNLFFGSITAYQSKKIFEDLHHVPTLSVQMTPSWSGGIPPIIITHAEATKQHGIFEVAKILKINTHDIIGVGDGYNDFPLLMACGLKIAMGNAVDELKEIADFIAPTVDDDGVAEVIDRFILRN